MRTRMWLGIIALLVVRPAIAADHEEPDSRTHCEARSMIRMLVPDIGTD